MIRWLDAGDGDYEVAIQGRYTLRVYLDHGSGEFDYELLMDNSRVVFGQATTIEHAKRKAEQALEEHRDVRLQ